ncbi:hypothetical protein [Alkaliphilus sp. B6464]|uniref:hypothetical protein n=1 Tax=Alkaliphilus sp. B6464 TaxID=2731219 RepID=UPI001BA8437B|nr:hypothetical protein [Alkaliphilus sp. B6464]QUH21769.1 hypothetical protein HYG84_17690 [Alkaliphilus sp. B6464]
MAKSYRAIRHDVVREKQKHNANEVHHPKEKIEQIEKILKDKRNLKIVEFFAGQGNLTKTYEKYANANEVECYDKKLKTGDSYLLFHKLIHEKRKYDVIDLDPYGFPNRFLPDIFLLIEDGYMFITMPKPYVNILNGITQQHLTCYFGEFNPSLNTILEKIKLYALCHWRDSEVLDVTDLGRLWRIALRVKRVKATEYTGIRNR